jgi:hypothetical protein
MRRTTRSFIFAFICLGLIPLSGCGVSQKKLNEAEARIKALQGQGVPDSLLSEAQVQLAQARSSIKVGDAVSAKRQFDSVQVLIAKASGSFESSTKELKPAVESLKKGISARKAELSGLQLKYVDSMLTVVDAFAAKGQWAEAKANCSQLDSEMPNLLKDEQLTKMAREALVGTWINTTNHKEDGVKAVEKKSFTFKADGSLKLVEEMKGQTAPNRKEDWLFESTGTYQLKGDTALLSITREKCPRQSYWFLKGSKWAKSDKPTYDSTITDGRKDRFVTYAYIKETFKKK